MPKKMCVFGEIGLAGEIRGVSFAEKRISEAAKMSFRQMIIPYVTGMRRQIMPMIWKFAVLKFERSR